jgi:hypothetical protein
MHPSVGFRPGQAHVGGASRPAFVPRTTGRRQEMTGTAEASNQQVRRQIRPSPQVARSAPRTLSRWRHGFEPGWDYAGQRPYPGFHISEWPRIGPAAYTNRDAGDAVPSIAASPLRRPRALPRSWLGLPTNRPQGVHAGEALELDVGGIGEREQAGAFRQLSDESRHEDLTSPCLRCDSRGEDHGFPEEVVLLADHLARVEPDPHAEPMPIQGSLNERPLDTDRALQGVLRGRERQRCRRASIRGRPKRGRSR